MSDIYAKLTKPFPKKALKPVPGQSYLTSIDAQYVVERLNEVFEFNGWSTEYEVLTASIETVVIKCRLTGDGWHREAFGGASNKKRKDGSWNMTPGDLYKSAMTSSLSKAASHIGVGNEIYKGNESQIVQNLNEPVGGEHKRISNGSAQAPQPINGDTLGAWVFPKGKFEGKSLKEVFQMTDNKNPLPGQILKGYYDYAVEKNMDKGYFKEFRNLYPQFVKAQNNKLAQSPINGPAFNSEENIPWE